MGSCVSSKSFKDTDVTIKSPAKYKSLKKSEIPKADIVMPSESKSLIPKHTKINKSLNNTNIIETEFDKYDRKLLLSGYVRSMVSNDILIPLQIEEIIKQYHYPFSLPFTLNEQIDYKDDDGYWFLATIETHKHANISLLSYPYFTPQQTQQISKYNKLEGLLISYKEYHGDTYLDHIKKWIFIEKDCICDCDGQCIQLQKKQGFHSINKANMNDKEIKTRKTKFERTRASGTNTMHVHQPQDIDWNSSTFQRMERDLKNIKQPDWNSPTFQRMERDLRNMKQPDWNSSQFQRMNLSMSTSSSMNTRSNFRSTGFAGSRSFGGSRGFG